MSRVLRIWIVLVAFAASSVALADDGGRALLFDLKSGNPGRIAAALDTVTEKRDARFAAPLIELIRADQVGITNGFTSLRACRRSPPHRPMRSGARASSRSRSTRCIA